MKVSINPPPANLCCERCGKHIDELKAFGGAGDPLVGDFTGAKLLKTYREVGGCVGAFWECRDCIILPDDTSEWYDDGEDYHLK